MKPAKSAGFSLIEVLVVLAVIAILSALLVPSLRSVLSATALTEANNNVLGILSVARQSAITQNTAVEVRLYQYADPTFTGETTGNANSGKFRAIQLFKLSGTGTAIAIGKVERFNPGIIIDSSATLSSLIIASQAKTWTTTDTQIPLPGGIGTNYNCRAFRFRSDGTTDLSSVPPSPPGTWCMTLHSVTLGDGLTQPPANFVTIQIDPLAGKVIAFRP